MLLTTAAATAQSHKIDSYSIDRFNFSLDYGNTRIPMLDNGIRRQISGQFEFKLNNVFSFETYINHDIDGWRPYYNGYFGAPIVVLNKSYKWNHINTDYYAGIRLYPYDQWHSESIRVRHKTLAGFYVSFGRAVSNFKNRGFLLEHYQGWQLDTITNTMYPVTDSSFIHYANYKIRQWGPSFGFGWKQFHNQFLYTDIAIYSNAYWRDNRRVTGSYYNDPDSYNPPYKQEEWEEALRSVNFWAKNGYGFFFKASIGINLDFKR